MLCTKFSSRSTVLPGKLPYQLQGLGVLLHLFEMSSGPAPGEVMVQVIELDCKCGPVPGLDDVPDVVEVGDALVVAKEQEGVHDMLREPSVPQFSGIKVTVLQNVVQESADHLLFIAPGHTDGKGMKDGGTTIEVLRESLRQLFDCSEMINRIHY